VFIKKSGKSRALIGFGSVGKDVDRVDEFSDLDFLIIVKKGYKSEVIMNMGWLTSIGPVDFYYMHTKDGFKLFYKDGIYCEFGILNEDEINQIPHGEGRVIWSEADFNENLCRTTKECDYEVSDTNWAVGEALTNLYVGLCRYARGEKLSASRFIQNSAVDSLLACSNSLCEEIAYFKDPFQNERRYPSLASSLPDMIQGYEKSAESALAILGFIEIHFEINPLIKKKFRILLMK
jgi:lincosamide nucleotidyltransferase